MSARDETLARIRHALGAVPRERPEPDLVSRAYPNTEPPDVVGRFIERLSDYEATVHRIDPCDVRAAVAARCRGRHLRRIAVPDDIPDEWAPEGIELVRESGLDALHLTDVDGAVTGCALAIAETGTIVLDSGPHQGRRALTLVPDYHMCIVREDDIVGDVREAMARIAVTLRETRRPVTLISGPSATSDVEFSRVEGVHGPRTLEVLLVTPLPRCN